MANIAVLGNTTWGTTLALLALRAGANVRIWTRSDDEARRLNAARADQRSLPSITLPDELTYFGSIKETLNGASMLIVAVPSQTVRENMALAADHVGSSMLIMSASKGLEQGSGKRISEVIADTVNPRYHKNICSLSGPNLSGEIVQNMPATTVVAAADIEVATRAQQIMSSKLFRVYISEDITGVELGGALKNIIALSAGMSDGLNYGDNAKSALITRGLAEISRLGIAMGANPFTFYGLAGLGDLVTTCASKLSRNHHVGEHLAKGKKLDEITSSMTGIAEGITASVVARELAHKLSVEMPITEQVYRVLYKGVSVKQAMQSLMERELRHERAGLDR
ncbi:MAG: NAD(P)-dependent glycerol-3-phosphate dehydrogenase [Chloroflexi bacterium]|nr:NAD(P)-dependent glycerol-3-phosphate dehydrogenase [Chloroflexota bacterium]MBT7080685.1 NAD(P)-dependent glycerol-3-phosphate dehydrogenase [Chloroflexota bacterium]MBT7289588.1 NAD(P)-dependent glycerol-3-phosphate dehydrogenase [Chloroflexota bacterium]